MLDKRIMCSIGEATETIYQCLQAGRSGGYRSVPHLHSPWLTQARHWASTEEAWTYEAPVPVEAVSCSTEGEMVKVIEKMADNGHDVQSDFRGGMSGHRCTRCDLFRCEASVAYWSEGPRCTPKASSLERKEDFITDQL